jgi:hypothetical protein
MTHGGPCVPSFSPVAAAIDMEESGVAMVGGKFKAIGAGLTALGKVVLGWLNQCVRFRAPGLPITTAGACAGSSMRYTLAGGRSRCRRCRSR